MARQHQWPNAAFLLLAAGLLAGSVEPATGGLGYLPAVGPAPVRFQAPVPVVPIAWWPPLAKPAPVAQKNAAQTTDAPPAGEVKFESPWIDSPWLEPPTNAAPPSIITAASPAAAPPPSVAVPFPVPEASQPNPATEGLVNPQALLSYLLTVSTNEAGANVLMPMFVPPQPPAAYPSSHATYESR